MRKVACIIAGSGGSNLLSGLREIDGLDRTAIVTMMDSGGSSGIIRDERGLLPPSDVMRCIAALMTTHYPAYEQWQEVFRLRFKHRNGGKPEGLDTHSGGNLLFSLLEENGLSATAAAQKLGEMFRIRGSVLPVTDLAANLVVELEDGTVIHGETNVDVPKHDAHLRIVQSWLEPAVSTTAPVAKAIREAHLVVIGPGDLLSSLNPSLLVDGVAAALRSTRAKLCYVVNLMTKRGETSGGDDGYRYEVSDFVRVIEEAIGRPMDYIIVNDGRPDPDLREFYHREEGQRFVRCNIDDDPRVIKADLIDREAERSDQRLIRHDAKRLAAIIKMLAYLGGGRD